MDRTKKHVIVQELLAVLYLVVVIPLCIFLGIILSSPGDLTAFFFIIGPMFFLISFGDSFVQFILKVYLGELKAERYQTDADRYYKKRGYHVGPYGEYHMDAKYYPMMMTLSRILGGGLIIVGVAIKLFMFLT